MNHGVEPGQFLAEWYLRDLTDQAVNDVVAKLDLAAAAVRSEGTAVRLLITLSVPLDEVLYGVFDAPSPESVAATCERAGVPHQRLTAHVGTRIKALPDAC